MLLGMREIKHYGWVPDTPDQRDHLYAAPAVFGFAKVCYRGVAKNANRLCVACALANLFMVRRTLLLRQQQGRPMNDKPVPIGRSRTASGGQTPIRHPASSLQQLNEHDLFGWSEFSYLSSRGNIQ